MGFFNRFFGSAEGIAKDLRLKNEDLDKEWGQYVQTVPEKKNLSDNSTIDGFRFLELVKLGMGNSYIEMKDSEDVLRDLKAIKHYVRMQKVHRLQQTLDYAENRYRYVYELIVKIYSILRTELYLIRLIEQDKNNRKFVKHLQEQIELEMLVIKKVMEIDRKNGTGTFGRLFSSLVRGEAIIENLDTIAKRHFVKMQKIFSNEVEDSITFRWVQRVVSEMEERIAAEIADGILFDHPDTDFEFVNSLKFVDIVRESIKSLKTKGKVSERMIQIFVEEFRRGFNQLRLNAA